MDYADLIRVLAAMLKRLNSRFELKYILFKVEDLSYDNCKKKSFFDKKCHLLSFNVFLTNTTKNSLHICIGEQY